MSDKKLYAFRKGKVAVINEHSISEPSQTTYNGKPIGPTSEPMDKVITRMVTQSAIKKETGK